MAGKGRRGEERRAQIRTAAYRRFRDTGYHDTTVDDVCDAAGISKGTFYWHYASKQEVFIDILDTWTREVMDELYEQFEAALNSPDYVQTVTDALKREIQRGRLIVPLWLEFTVQARREPEISKALSSFYRRARTAIHEMLRPLLAPRFGEEEIAAIAAVFFGAYTGLIVQDLSDPERGDAEEVVRAIVAVIGRNARLGPA